MPWGRRIAALATFLSVPSGQSGNATYTPDQAAELMHFAEATYCPDKRVLAWDCPSCKQEPSFNLSYVVDQTADDTHGLVGFQPGKVSTDPGSVIVAFRGTDPLNIASWIVDLKSAVLEDYANCAGCKIGKGFLSAFERVKNKTVAAVLAEAQRHPGAQLQLSGHSLGSAYVTLLAYELWHTYQMPFTIVTFGQPRIGNAAFASAYDRAIAASDKSASWRVTHFADPVPHLPLEAMGFRHVAREVHYNELNTHFVICNGSGEDPKCADGVLGLLLPDHWSYLGISFLEDFIACKV